MIKNRWEDMCVESNDKIQSAKKEFDAIAENETANFKITLLEKHLMESREAQQELKQQELELRDKQLAVIADMQKANEEAKAIDRLLADKIDESVQSIKTEMFASWQETVRDALVAETKSLSKTSSTNMTPSTASRTRSSARGRSSSTKLTTSYRFMKLLCALSSSYHACVCDNPDGQYAFEEISSSSARRLVGRRRPAAAVILLSLAVALAVLLRRKESKK
ncbi:MAG: hypothetical protein ACLUFV_03475 [Acutalibacteraceae bacterium]